MSKLRYAFFSDPDIALRTYIISSKEHLDSILEKLARIGVFEPVLMDNAGKEVERIKEYITLVEECKKIFDVINSYIEEPLTVEITDLPPDVRQELLKLRERLGKVLAELKVLDGRKKENTEKLKELEVLERYVKYLEPTYRGASGSILDYDGTLIVARTVLGSRTEVEAVKKRALFTVGELTVDEQNIITTLIFERDVIDEIIKEFSGKNLKVIKVRTYEAGTLGDMVSRIGSEKEAVRRDLEYVEARMREVVNTYLPDIALLKVLIDAEYTKIELLKIALESKYLSLLVGWIPRSKKELLLGELRGRPVHVIFEEAAEPPVDFNNLEPFKPFEMFTELNGYPSPREWDPTPFLTYFFAFFVALMLPDVGYAIGLLIASKLFLPLFVQSRETLQKLQRVVNLTAICMVVTGLLSASFFGNLLGSYIPLPPVLPSLSSLEQAADYVLRSIVLALYIGYISMLVTHGVGLLKAVIKTRDMWTAIGEVVIISLMIFGPPYLTWKLGTIDIDVFKLGDIVPQTIVEYVVFTSLGIYILYKIKTTGPLGAMMWIFDVIGPFADVLSFIRIAGVGAASSLLAAVFNTYLASFVSSVASINIAIGIIVGVVMGFLLHVFILASSVLGPYIHALRLISYEMATKFYEGAGRRIAPVKVSLGPTIFGGSTR